MSFRISRLSSFGSFKDKGEKEFDMTILQEGRPSKQGFLVKHKCIRGDYDKATITNNWRKRWFLLINDCLVYFKLPSDTKPKGWIPLDGATVEMAEERTGKACCFAIRTKLNTTFLLIAGATNILSDWTGAIRSVTDNNDLSARSSISTSTMIEAVTPPLSARGSTTDVLGRQKPPPITVGLKRVRFKTEIQGNGPEPCHLQTAFLIDGLRMVVFGGMNAQNTCSGDVSVFNLGSATWDPYTITGDAPIPRSGHSSNNYQEFVYSFGGTTGNRYLNDLQELNIDELSWRKPDVTGEVPSARSGHASCIYNAGLYIIGGTSGPNQFLNDIYCLDILSMAWTRLDNMLSTTEKMPPHANQVCGVFDSGVILFGGRNSDGLSDQVFMFEIREKCWIVEQPKGTPPPAREYAACHSFKNRVLFIMGGLGKDGILNDAWALDATGYVWMKIQVGGNPVPAMFGSSICIKDQIMYVFGGKLDEGLTNTVLVLKISDKGLPSINLQNATRPSIVQRMQLRNPCLADFDVGVVLGTGSFGRVHCVKYKKTSQFYAMKVLKKKEIIQLGQVEHINAERDVLSSISHPHIVNFFGSFQDPKKLYIVMEFVCGGEFFHHLRHAGRFKEDTARFYVAEILTALEYLHSNNIVYRDLKPENILLDSLGHAKITDFGFAKQIDFRTWTLCGTPEYLAPEIILSKGHAKPADYWALGVLAFEMMAGYPPFYDDDPLKIYKKILKGEIKWPYHFSEDAKDLITKLLEADVNKRLGSSKKGAHAIKEHPWFSTINWDEISGTSLSAPIKPKVKNEGDTSNFESYPDEQDENWPDCSEAENAKFSNFG
eukprot:c20597_g1_i1.p1 GENE.c20597_g1_i1~~c20597_g1_i1.p1  ORF type:complete len:830 (+),score=258.33 c20597_g1_i1:58-2547(+)